MPRAKRARSDSVASTAPPAKRAKRSAPAKRTKKAAAPKKTTTTTATKKAATAKRVVKKTTTAAAKKTTAAKRTAAPKKAHAKRTKKVAAPKKAPAKKAAKKAIATKVLAGVAIPVVDSVADEKEDLARRKDIDKTLATTKPPGKRTWTEWAKSWWLPALKEKAAIVKSDLANTKNYLRKQLTNAGYKVSATADPIKTAIAVVEESGTPTERAIMEETVALREKLDANAAMVKLLMADYRDAFGDAKRQQTIMKQLKELSQENQERTQGVWQLLKDIIVTKPVIYACIGMALSCAGFSYLLPVVRAFGELVDQYTNYTIAEADLVAQKRLSGLASHAQAHDFTWLQSIGESINLGQKVAWLGTAAVGLWHGHKWLGWISRFGADMDNTTGDALPTGLSAQLPNGAFVAITYDSESQSALVSPEAVLRADPEDGQKHVFSYTTGRGAKDFVATVDASGLSMPVFYALQALNADQESSQFHDTLGAKDYKKRADWIIKKAAHGTVKVANKKQYDAWLASVSK